MSNPGARLAWYLAFSVVIAGAMAIANLPAPILVGYLLIAAIGFAMAVRDVRAAARAEFVAGVEAAQERIAQRIHDAEAAARSLPWYQDVAAAQARAIARGGYPFGLFGSFNPYWSLDREALLRHGLTIPEQVEVIEAMIRDGPPADWLNGFIINELCAGGDSYHEALVRVGLYRANEHRFRAE